MYKLELEKAEKSEIKLPTSIDHRESKGIAENHLLLHIDYLKPFDCVDHSKLENFQCDRNTRPSYLPPEKSVSRSGRNS